MKTYRKDTMLSPHLPLATIKNGLPFNFRLRDYTACDNDPDVGVEVTYNNTKKVFVVKALNFSRGKVFTTREVDTSKYNNAELMNVYRFERKKVLKGAYDDVL